MIHAFPKIFTIGQDYIQDIFKEEVEITEKIDGSMFCFGKISGESFMRSKGAQIFREAPDKMFKPAVQYVETIEDRLSPETVYYCEYLQKPRHNILAYSRVPQNNLILFGIVAGGTFIRAWDVLAEIASIFDIEVVPLLYLGRLSTIEMLKGILDRDSILGGTKIEGVVVKNYYRPFLLGGQPIPLMMGKYVSENFKEVHRERWGKENTHAGKWETFKESFRTEARWLKAVQRLGEQGLLENAPKDIGALVAEVKRDVLDEEYEDIKNFLWKEFGQEVLRGCTRGLPEWYKDELLRRALPEAKIDAGGVSLEEKGNENS